MQDLCWWITLQEGSFVRKIWTNYADKWKLVAYEVKLSGKQLDYTCSQTRRVFPQSKIIKLWNSFLQAFTTCIIADYSLRPYKNIF